MGVRPLSHAKELITITRIRNCKSFQFNGDAEGWNGWDVRAEEQNSSGQRIHTSD